MIAAAEAGVVVEAEEEQFGNSPGVVGIAGTGLRVELIVACV